MHFTTLAAFLLPFLASALVIPTPTTGHDNANGGALKIREIHAKNAINYSPGNGPAGFYDRREDLGDDQETQAEDFGETGLKERSLEVRDETTDEITSACGLGISEIACYYAGGYDPLPPPGTPCVNMNLPECRQELTS